jgi:hypothetical protein
MQGGPASELLMDSTGQTTERERPGAFLELLKIYRVNLSIEKCELLLFFPISHTSVIAAPMKRTPRQVKMNFRTCVTATICEVFLSLISELYFQESHAKLPKQSAKLE